jgi:hypothetical protein
MKQQLVHKKIAEVAKAIAAAEYDRLAYDNRFYKKYPTERGFVGKNWRYYIKIARMCMTHLLSKPDFPEAEKEKIFEALMLDRSLPQGGASVAAVPSAIIH